MKIEENLNFFTQCVELVNITAESELLLIVLMIALPAFTLFGKTHFSIEQVCFSMNFGFPEIRHQSVIY